MASVEELQVPADQKERLSHNYTPRFLGQMLCALKRKESCLLLHEWFWF